MTIALLFAGSEQDANDSAAGWGWHSVNEMRSEYERPDTRERIRFVQDSAGTLQGLTWNTTVYLGKRWKSRKDIVDVIRMLDCGFFRRGDPMLPPPRRRRREAVK